MYSTNNVHTDNRINCSPYLQRINFLCTTQRSDKLSSCLCCKNILCYSSPICSTQEGKFRHFVTPSPQKIYPQSMLQKSLGYAAHNCCVSEKDLTRETKYMTRWLKRTEIWMFFVFFFFYFFKCVWNTKSYNQIVMVTGESKERALCLIDYLSERCSWNSCENVVMFLGIFIYRGNAFHIWYKIERTRWKYEYIWKF